MKIPTMLLERVLFDMALQLIDTVDNDVVEIRRRFKDEGMSFLTITLPRLDDCLLAGLRRGYLTRRDFEGFRPRGRRGSLPALLSGFFRLVFEDDGRLRNDPNISAIAAIRQVSRLFKKVELPCSERRIKAAYERYRSNDERAQWQSQNCGHDASLFASVRGHLWSGIEGASERMFCAPGDFGPGVTQDGLARNERYSISEWPVRSEASFPSSFHAMHTEDCDNNITYLSEEQERPVRVVQVPKTLKTPRTISVEPSYMMLMQQSIAKPLMQYLESFWDYKSIRFSDQSVNRDLARRGSVDGSLATIDLKDASDLVSNDLVRYIFEGPCPTFWNMIQDCRTRHAAMPDGTIFPLRKFASMGSALCFPIESMVFFTLAVYAIVKSSGIAPSKNLIKKISREVAVYGDDIIVPSSTAPDVIRTLEGFGLSVNCDKSFFTGLFRESCGGDYYAGVDTTPAYVRRWDDTGTLSDPSLLAAYVSLSNQFYLKGLWKSAQAIRDYVESRWGPIPRSRTPCGIVTFASVAFDTNLSWDRRLHCYRVKGIVLKAKQRADAPTTMAGYMLRSFSAKHRSEWLSSNKYTSYLGSTRLRHNQRDGWVQPSELPNGNFGWLSPDLHTGSVVNEGGPLLQGSDGHPLNTERFTTFNVEGYLQNVWEGSHSGVLKPLVASSLTQSTRPHVLGHKRAWTRSRAGLLW